jgi:hypothetical protein
MSLALRLGNGATALVGSPALDLAILVKGEKEKSDA